MKKLILLIVSIVAIFSCAAFGDVGPVGRSTTLDGKGVIRDGGVEKWFINEFSACFRRRFGFIRYKCLIFTCKKG